MLLLLKFDEIIKLLRQLEEKGGSTSLESVALANHEEKISTTKQFSKRSRTERIPLDVSKIKQMRNSGMTLQAIGEEMGVSATTIRNRLLELAKSE